MTDDELRRLFDELRQEMREGNAAIRLEIGQGDDALRTDLTAVRTDLTAVRTDLSAEVTAVRHELTAEVTAIRHDLTAMRQDNFAAHAETRRHFDVLFEATRHEVGLVAESVALLGEKLDRTGAELDRRLSALE